MIKRPTVCALCHSREALISPPASTPVLPHLPHCLHPPDPALLPRLAQMEGRAVRGQGSSSALVAFFHSTRDVAERGHKEPQLNGLTIPDTPSSPSTIAPGPIKRRITIHLHLSSSWRRRPSPRDPSATSRAAIAIVDAIASPFPVPSASALGIVPTNIEHPAVDISIVSDHLHPRPDTSRQPLANSHSPPQLIVDIAFVEG